MNIKECEILAMAAMTVAELRPPDNIIGGSENPYLKRWIIRHSGPSGGLYLHQILRDDDDRALHDHPWDFGSYIIEGSYREIRSDCPEGEVFEAGSYREVVAETLHRLVLIEPVWSLIFLGPRRREWGFQCPQGWRHWREFVASDDPGAIGKGCE